MSFLHKLLQRKRSSATRLAPSSKPEEHDKLNSGVLSREEIKSFGLIAEPAFDDNFLQTCSYDLRLGDKHFLFDDNGRLSGIYLGTDGNMLAAENEGAIEDEEKLHFPVGQPDILRIPPFGSAIIELKEVIDTFTVAEKYHRLVVGRFDLKLKAIYKGLISQQATQVEPCYKGKLYCFLHNLTSQEILIRRDEPVATIEFLYAGVAMDSDTVDSIVKKTKEKNKRKYAGKYVYHGTGISDVRFLRRHGSMPRECGLAPINRKVNNNIETEIQRYLEKDSTVDRLSERVGKRIDEHQGVVKLVLSLIVAAISLFGVSFVTDVLTQLQYFEQELAFLIDEKAGTIDATAIAAMKEHSNSFVTFRESLLFYTIIAVVIVVLIALIYYFFISEHFWARKMKRLEGKIAYSQLKDGIVKPSPNSNNKKSRVRGSIHRTKSRCRSRWNYIKALGKITIDKIKGSWTKRKG